MILWWKASTAVIAPPLVSGRVGTARSLLWPLHPVHPDPLHERHWPLLRSYRLCSLCASGVGTLGRCWRWSAPSWLHPPRTPCHLFALPAAARLVRLCRATRGSGARTAAAGSAAAAVGGGGLRCSPGRRRPCSTAALRPPPVCLCLCQIQVLERRSVCVCVCVSVSYRSESAGNARIQKHASA